MNKIEELQQRLAQLSQERAQLSISYNQFTGAMTGPSIPTPLPKQEVKF
jgi:hypothetical protein